MGKDRVMGCIPVRAVEAVIACCIYCVCSNAMVLSNKAILSYFDFRFPLSLMLFQAFCTAAILQVGKLTGMLQCEDFNMKTARKILPLNILFVSMICTAGYATEYLSVPFLTIFKNLTNVVITFGESRIFGKSVSNGVLLSIAVMVMGSVCAAFNDIQFSKPGYFWMFCNCAVSAGYVLYMKVAMDSTKLSKNGMAFYNNAMGMPLIGCLVLSRERNVLDFDDYGNFWFIVVVSVSGIVGFGMSLATFYTISTTSPTTYSMVGALNKIPASILGAIFFSAQISFGGWVGISIGLLGGIVFALAKANESSTQRQRVVYLPVAEDRDDDHELLNKSRS